MTRRAEHRSMPSNFKSFLRDIRAKAKSEREKGAFFERAVRDFLQKSPEYPFENVWLWPNWPDLSKYGFSKKDLGIDLVAKEQETGRLWAIQCKCFDENYKVERQDIDSFFTYSGKKPFEVRLIVTTTANWSANAEEALKRQTKECKTLDLHNLETADFEWSFQKVKRKTEQKYLRDHQKEAVRKSAEHFKTKDRGKLIMACGTGKTFTSLRIAERITPENGNILFLAPSISLISQTLREFAWQRKKPQRYLAVCSDAKAGKDTDGYDVNDLQISPTTDPKRIAERLKIQSGQRTVVFSTYQSLKKIKDAQNLGAPVFDLVVCDEAHRTTGVEAGEGENGKSAGNYFTRINDPHYVRAKKRLYMTATPKIYSDRIKSKAKKHDVEIHSMDDEANFGKEIYKLSFSEAIEKKLLSDYKVIILSIDERYMSDNIQEALKDTELKLNDASRLVGCYKALRDQGDEKRGVQLSRAVGFLNTIRASKDVTQEFKKIVKALDKYQNDGFTCETEHIDGGDSSIIRNKKLDWLKENAGETDRGEKISRILFNSKCLTEGVDVPSLDAVMFLHPRKSQVDVVQAVGRIMRKLEGKQYGYVILPVVIPAGKSPDQALNDNETYKVVWQVLNALRSHDSKFNALVNDLELNKNKPDKIKVVGIGFGSEEERKEVEETTNPQIQLNLQFSIEEIEDKIYAKIVEKCGDRIYEEKWTKEIEKACKTISARIKSLLKTNRQINKEFQTYCKGLKSCINEDITEGQAVSMLSEHLITRPAFDKIFENYKFSENNPVSKTMKKVLDRLDDYGFRNELKDLEKFYQGISRRIEGIDNSEGRQTVIKELYENFIKTAFPKTAEKLGVAYTPVEIVDFILRSADEILKDEFGKRLTDEGVHIIDPFVGTGTFLNRLICDSEDSKKPANSDLKEERQLIKKEDLARKFRHELHANDILLLPYYVASINIEEAYWSRMGGRYTAFPRITLSDIFNRNEKEEQLALFPYFEENNRRIKKQQEVDLQVIIGNPPYSSGQKSENDANKNTVYPKLHKRIEETYVKESSAQLNTALYDSYIKAVRWASDEIKNKGGIIGFVHNGSLVSERSTAGLRKSLVKEFDSIYCLNLRGNQRTKGELSKKEGGKIFGGSSRTPVAITFLIKKPLKNTDQASVSAFPLIRGAVQNNQGGLRDSIVPDPFKSNWSNQTGIKKPATIKYFDIGDSLSREDKLETVKNFRCIKGIGSDWKIISPDKYGDWINQRDDSFYQFMSIGDKKIGNRNAVFSLYSQGVKTHRDSWAYNFSKDKVLKNMKNIIDFYNMELERLKDKELTAKNIDQFINRDEKKIKWSSHLKSCFDRKKRGVFKEGNVRFSSYRPFTKSHLYFDNMFNDRISQNPKIFPKEITKNKVICVSGVGAKTFSVLMTNFIPDVGFMPSGQCFPLYLFDNDNDSDAAQKSLLENKKPEYSITDSALNRFKNHYKKRIIYKNKTADTNRLLKREAAAAHLQESSGETNNGNIDSMSSAGSRAVGQDFAFEGEEQTDNQSFNQKSKICKTFSGKEKSPDSIAKEDIFYYIYGLLHSEDYRERYKSNLDKDLPRIPLVPEFWEFSSIGRKLSDLHLNYENQPPPKEVKVLKDGKEINLSESRAFSPHQLVAEAEDKSGRPRRLRLVGSNESLSLSKGLLPEDLKVQKMKLDKKDRSKIQFNDRIAVADVPPEAWEYKINGWPAPKWIMNRYQYKRDKKTGLVNDPNAYSDDPAYILKLLLSVITVSLKTRELVRSLPSIDFDSLISSIKKTG